MNCKFTKIILRDCYAFEYQEFNFTSGIHSINGVNGASKTSIYLALAQGLFNKNPKNVRIEDVSNTITKRPYEILIYFQKGTDEYSVCNSRKTGKITITVNGKSISRKTIPQNLELLREILGDSYETFVGITYQASDSTLDLLEESSDLSRKNFINKVLRFDELDTLMAETREKLKKLRSEIKEKQNNLEYLIATILPLKAEDLAITTDLLEERAKAAEVGISVTQRILLQTAKDLEAQEHKREAYTKYLRQSINLQTNEEELAKIERPEKSKERLSKELDEVNGKLNAVVSIYNNSSKELRNLEEPELECSRCGAVLDSDKAVKLYLEDKEKLEAKVQWSKNERFKLSGKAESLREDIAVWDEVEGLTRTIEGLKQNMQEVEVADNGTYSLALEENRKADEAYKAALKDHSEALQKLSEANRHNDLVAMVKKFNEEARATNAGIEAKAKKLSEEVDELAHRLDLLDNWARILGPSGYRVHSMKMFLAILNKTMDKYSTLISGGKIKCSFYVSEEGKIEFTVVDPDKQMPFPNWSKGEQARVKLACLFAVIEVQEIMGSASYNVLVLDEIFSALDDEGKEGLFNVLSYLRDKGKCIYTISHTPLVNPVVFDSTIEVVKSCGLATIL